MTYKAPNLNGPRVKKKSSHVMSESLFKEFKKKHPEHESMTLTQFNIILRQFNNNIIDEVIDYRFGVSLPERLGHFVIASFPRTKRKIIDFGKSNKTGVKTYHRNWDTDNRLGKIMYQNSSSTYNIKYHRLWTFRPTRNFKERMSVAFKKMWAKYIFIDNKNITLKTMLK
jgi:hypothetical protein